MRRGSGWLAIASIAAVVAVIVAYRSMRSVGSSTASSALAGTREPLSDLSLPNLDAGSGNGRPADALRESVPASIGSASEPGSDVVKHSGAAVLVVKAVEGRTHEPISRIQIRPWRKNGGDLWLGPGGLSMDDLASTPLTDKDGLAEVAVPPEIDLTVAVRGQGVECQDRFVEVPSLRVGERRELLVELACGNDLRFFGQVIDAVESQPIAGAKAFVSIAEPSANARDRNSSKLSRTTTDANGRFELALPSWKHPFVRVEAEGFGLVVLRRLDGHDAPERELMVRLPKAASLEAVVRDAGGGPMPGVILRLSADGSSLPPDAGAWIDVDVPDERWYGVTADDGTCTLEGLSPGVGIAIELSKEGRLLRREEDEVTLEPGQVLKREWIFGAGATLKGLVLDQDSRPVPDLPVWLANWEPEPPAHFFQTYEEDRVSAKAVTDDEGKFQFADVQPGTWWIGPAPTAWNGIVIRDGPLEENEPPANAVAPTATSVVVQSAPTQDVTLRVHRGLYIRGRVLDPDGRPAPEVYVIASPGSNGLGPQTSSGSDGTFVLGPLAPGRYEVAADANGRLASPDPVEAEAGASDVLLRLRAGGGLRARVVDSRTGKPCTAEMLLTPRISTRGVFGQGTGFGAGEDGIVDKDGLIPGDYDLAARTEDGSFGILSGISVVAGEKGKEFILSVSPGGTLKVRNEGSHPAEFRLKQQGVLIEWSEILKAGQPIDLHAPAGTFAIEYRFDDEAPFRSQTIVLNAGEVKEARLTDE